jgi:hypothetical protein
VSLMRLHGFWQYHRSCAPSGGRRADGCCGVNEPDLSAALDGWWDHCKGAAAAAGNYRPALVAR